MITAAEAVIPNQGIIVALWGIIAALVAVAIATIREHRWITVPAFIVALSMGLAAYCGGGT